ncbi:uncharacterized protein GIQ15_00751 [Arthroderma uncinatum]|uniref:uncharacterized protein n=1 Tax=Arthroderma uncinatum TaxID=74035 RepID=UPI00144A6251|nr:uncharacterized protein GIQ15_00751 [Arthroderma uncinatum]KAF3491234.1 hypothetical protein GIQ15_00751 [Arthroderma uncinatum]
MAKAENGCKGEPAWASWTIDQRSVRTLEPGSVEELGTNGISKWKVDGAASSKLAAGIPNAAESKAKKSGGRWAQGGPAGHPEIVFLFNIPPASTVGQRGYPLNEDSYLGNSAAMTASFELQTVAGRLATFDVAHHGKAESTTWPYTTPSPDELAHAGFHYTPTALSPDNTTCFLCERSLDGWEEGDDPFAEHLRFSPQCGWAIIMNIAQQTSDPAQIEDPTGPEIADARRATFFSWPHDGKRGWVCKTEKMVEAGWYFCPNEESDDLVSCPYCKLSLDGWEPKDKPFDEHYRRSSDCSFFAFAKQPKKGRGPGKAGRGSKASRLSTQSNTTTASEAPTVDFDDAMDQSMMSQSATSTSKATKKTAKSKSRSSKLKKEDGMDLPSQPDIVEKLDRKEDSILYESPSRGTKRKSEAISGIGWDNLDEDSRLQPEPKPKKKRVTATRTKKAQRTTGSTVDYAEPTDDELGLDAAPQPKRGRKKGSTSKGRKASTASNASTAPLKSQIPNDDEIDAELEADLDKDLPTESITNKAVEKAPGRPRHSSTAPTAPVRRKVSPQVEDCDELPKQETQKKHTTKKSTKKKQISTSSVDKLPASDLDQLPQPTSEADVEMDEPVVSIPIQSPELKAESREPDPEPKKVKQSKKTKSTTSSTKGRKKKADSGDVKDITTAETAAPAEDTTIDREKPVARLSKGRNSSKNTRAGVDEGDSSAQNLDTDTQSQKNAGPTREAPIIRRPSKQVRQASPPTANPSTQLSPRDNTPSPSPQSSDAENQPPSSRPSTMSRAHPHTTSQPIKVPLTTKTPVLSPAKGETRSRQLATADPWEPVDLDEAFLPDPTGKENLSLNDILHAAKDGVTSPEKRMNIEEWIFWNAEKGEEKLRGECERVVGVFEREGGRAMHALDGIECID